VFPPGGGSYETQCFDAHRTFEKVIPGTSGVLFVQENNTVSVVDMSANQLLGSAQFDQNELYGQIIVAGDGNAYVTLISQDTTVTHPDDRTDAVHSVNTLELMGVSPDGTSAKTVLNSWTSDSTTTTLDTLPGVDKAHTFSAVHFTSSGMQPALGTNSIITNADNGVAVFVRIGSDAACSDGIVGTYLDADGSHTYSQGTGCGYEPERTFVAFAAKGSSGSHLEAQIKGFEPSLQREDGSFIGTARNNNLAAVALDGTVPWQTTLNPNITGVGDPITPLYATADGGAIVTSTTVDQFGTSSFGNLYTVDLNGNTVGQTADMGARITWANNWYSGLSSIVSTVFPPLETATSFAAFLNGNPSNNGAAQKPVTKDVRAKIAQIAQSKVGSRNWLDQGGLNKCNIFVHDAIKLAGSIPPESDKSSNAHRLAFYLGLVDSENYPAQAADWANSNKTLGCWKTVEIGPPPPPDFIGPVRLFRQIYPVLEMSLPRRLLIPMPLDMSAL
jgi:hypothetical protein